MTEGLRDSITPEDYLVHKKTQLFQMDVDKEFEDNVEVLSDEEHEQRPMPQISVNAVSGISGYKL